MTIPKIYAWAHHLKVKSSEQGSTVQGYTEELHRGIGEMAEAMIQKYFHDKLGGLPEDSEFKEHAHAVSTPHPESGHPVFTYTWKREPIIEVKLVRKSTLYLVEGRFL
jgi:hypothetical protein